MNKKILGIGATSAVAALLPVMGVFAATERTDTLNVTVEEGCAFAANATDHLGTWDVNSRHHGC